MANDPIRPARTAPLARAPRTEPLTTRPASATPPALSVLQPMFDAISAFHPAGYRSAVGDEAVRKLASNPDARGTKDDPLVIENQTMDGGWVAPALTIKDTKLHIVVRNCTFTRGKDRGVHVENTPHITFKDNTIAGTSGWFDPLGTERPTGQGELLPQKAPLPDGASEVAAFFARNSSPTIEGMKIIGVGGPAGRPGYAASGWVDAGDGASTVGMLFVGCASATVEDTSISYVMGGAGGAGGYPLVPVGSGRGGDGGRGGHSYGVVAIGSRLEARDLSIGNIYAGAPGAGATGVGAGAGPDASHATALALVDADGLTLENVSIAGVWGSAGSASAAPVVFGGGGVKSGDGGIATAVVISDSASVSVAGLEAVTIRGGAGAAGSAAAFGLVGAPGGEGGNGGKGIGIALHNVSDVMLEGAHVVETTGGAGGAAGAPSVGMSWGVPTGGQGSKGGDGGEATGFVISRSRNVRVMDAHVDVLRGAAGGVGSVGAMGIKGQRGGDGGAGGDATAFRVTDSSDVRFESSSAQVATGGAGAAGAAGSTGLLGGGAGADAGRGGRAVGYRVERSQDVTISGASVEYVQGAMGGAGAAGAAAGMGVPALMLLAPAGNGGDAGRPGDAYAISAEDTEGLRYSDLQIRSVAGAPGSAGGMGGLGSASVGNGGAGSEASRGGTVELVNVESVDWNDLLSR